jgi:vancomycin resistance protein YoaR
VSAFHHEGDAKIVGVRLASRSWWLAGGAGVVATVLVGGWALSSAAQDGRTHRNLAVAGRAAGGLAEADLVPIAEQLAADYRDVPVTLTADDGALSFTLGELGAAVDVDATVAAALDAGQPAPLVGWITTSFRDVAVEPVVSLDEDVLRDVISRADNRRADRAVEPSVVLSGETLVGLAGQPGQSIDAAGVVAGVLGAGFTVEPVNIDVTRVPTAPRLTLAQAEQAANEANQLTAEPMVITAGGATSQVSSAQQRSWIRVMPVSDGFRLQPEMNVIRGDIEQLLAAGGRMPTDAVITVVGDAPLLTAEVDGLVCCDTPAAELVADALLKPNRAPVDVPLRVIRPRVTADDIRALGIVEPVASFTTKHACCEPRVQNIHTAADRLRGTIIRPGETFSLNDALGERTLETGWVDAPTIKDGKLEPAPGGGLSQFATTLFNVAFFAGLDFGEYQSHSLYISRYPFAREATVNFPAPDLQIVNSSPYGMLMWPTYDDRNITITLFSTKWVASVEQGGQVARAAAKSCTAVTTERITTFLDGTKRTDAVQARYRAEEGLNCSDPLPPGVTLVAIPGQPPPTPNPQE